MLTPEPTDDELRAAYQRLRKPEWGNASFEELRAAAVRWSLIRLEAKHPRRPAGERMAEAIEEAAPPRVHTTPYSDRPRRAAAAAPALHVPHQPPLFDRKRAAAGDRDDDER